MANPAVTQPIRNQTHGSDVAVFPQRLNRRPLSLVVAPLMRVSYDHFFELAVNRSPVIDV